MFDQAFAFGVCRGFQGKVLKTLEVTFFATVKGLNIEL